jgi:chloramphenicol 3-O phosphotransferase
VIVVLNGAPRSGKSSIVEAIQSTFDGTWVNLGVDVSRRTTPPGAQPGIGLRPNEPDHPAARVRLALYSALWESVAAHDELGLHVAVDVGMYEAGVAADAARRLSARPVLFVGVRCPVEVAVERRRAAPDAYAPTREAAELWEREVHRHWTYDLEVDTSRLSPSECAAVIADRLADGASSSWRSQLGTFLA